MADMNRFEPLIIGFTCNWCSYRAADLAGMAAEHGLTLADAAHPPFARAEDRAALEALLARAGLAPT